jgi:hypothetical protein
MEYMIDSEARREYGIQKKYVRSTVFDYLDKVERDILEKKMDKIDDAIVEMSDSAFEKSKIEWRLKYAHLAAVAIQLAVEALLQECPGHFLGSEAKKVIKKPTEWHCEYDVSRIIAYHDILSLQWAESLCVMRTEGRAGTEEEATGSDCRFDVSRDDKQDLCFGRSYSVRVVLQPF